MAKKFVQTLDDEHYEKLGEIAKQKIADPNGRLQKLLRYTVIPDWLRANGYLPSLKEAKKK